MTALRFTLNGRRRDIEAPDNRVLADLLRDTYGLTGCKIGCDQSVCGVCTVLLNGKPFAACSTFAFAADGAEIITIEGLPAEHPVPKAFLACSAFQCGYCTPGMILSVVALLAHNPTPDEADIRAWLAGNICRCTGYGAIVDAVKACL